MIGNTFEDDKYTKASLKGKTSMVPVSFPRGVLTMLAEKGPTMSLYASFLLGGFVMYEYCGGSFRTMAPEDKLGYVSCLLEAFGLLVVRQKIEAHGKVSGISGMTMIMFALSYLLREGESLMMVKQIMSSVDGIAMETLQLSSVILCVNVTWMVFVTYRKTYDAELDVLSVKHLVPGCTLFALVIHPMFAQGWFYSFSWAVSFYIDVLALLPQVVMMSRGGGKVEAPICHFVAATTISRLFDLFFWYYRLDLGPQGFIRGFNYSGMLIVAFHIINLGLVADFMYYYIKAKVSGSKFSEDLTLPTIESV